MTVNNLYNFMNNNLKKIRTFFRYTLDDVANKIDMTRQNYWYLEKGDRNITRSNALKLSELFGCSVEDLYDPYFNVENLGKNKGQNKKLIPIKFYDLQASAGNGCFTSIENYETLNIGEDYLNKIGIRGNYNRIAIIRAKGISMYPTICDGDFLFVDTDNKELYNNKIYVINERGLLKVKRVLMSSPFSKTITIKSDNQQDGDYPPYDIEIDGCQNVICGTVIFLTRSL